MLDASTLPRAAPFIRALQILVRLSLSSAARNNVSRLASTRGAATAARVYRLLHAKGNARTLKRGLRQPGVRLKSFRPEFPHAGRPSMVSSRL